MQSFFKHRNPQAALAALLVCCAAALGSCPDGSDQGLLPPDAAFLRERMETLNAFLDSQEYAAAVSWEEHVAITYQLARGREPTPAEYTLLCFLREEPGLERSGVLALVLRGAGSRLTWAQCRAFLNQVNTADFRSTAEIGGIAKRLSSVSFTDIARDLVNAAFPEAPIQDVPKATSDIGYRDIGYRDIEYNTYFGYLHAHSELSLDARGDPLEAYEYARDQGGLDFFSLTDHGIFLAMWPWQNKWDQLVSAANATYEPGVYVTLWGFEWSNPVLGHLNVMNSSDFTDTVTTFRLGKFYRWLANRPAAFATFNHPGEFDFLGIQFLHFYPCAAVIPQVVGMELCNADKDLDRFYYGGSWHSDLSYWDVANLEGWYVGALGSQDNHRQDWGTRNEFRTGVLAEQLTREALIDAYWAHRFYATEDKNLYLDFRCAGYPMGSRLSGVPAEFTVNASDGGGDAFEEVRLYRNGILLDTQTVAGDAVSVTFTAPTVSGSNYYYVIVAQADDNDGSGRNDEAISSPIWLQE